MEEAGRPTVTSHTACTVQASTRSQGPRRAVYTWPRQRKANIQTKPKKHLQDFPRGPVVKNLSANAADTGSISGPGALHVLHSNQSYALLLPVLSHFGRVQPCETPWTAAHQAPLSMGVSRQEYWSGLPCPPAGDLPDPGAESTSLMSPALAVSSSSLVPPGKPIQHGSHVGKKDVKYINHFCIDYTLN